MILTYNECINKYGSDYKLKKEMLNGTVFLQEKGIYSTTQKVSDLEIISGKYANAVFTDKSAFHYHSLTDDIPDYFYLATKRDSSRMKDVRVKQSFVKDELFGAGIERIKYNDILINVYNKERMLIELMRFRSRLPFDYYKEIIQNYRRIVDKMDFCLVEDYACLFRNGEKMMNQIQMEVL